MRAELEQRVVKLDDTLPGGAWWALCGVGVHSSGDDGSYHELGIAMKYTNINHFRRRSEHPSSRHRQILCSTAPSRGERQEANAGEKVAEEGVLLHSDEARRRRSTQPAPVIVGSIEFEFTGHL